MNLYSHWIFWNLQTLVKEVEPGILIKQEDREVVCQVQQEKETLNLEGKLISIYMGFHLYSQKKETTKINKMKITILLVSTKP